MYYTNLDLCTIRHLSFHPCGSVIKSHKLWYSYYFTVSEITCDCTVSILSCCPFNLENVVESKLVVKAYAGILFITLKVDNDDPGHNMFIAAIPLDHHHQIFNVLEITLTLILT